MPVEKLIDIQIYPGPRESAGNLSSPKDQDDATTHGFCIGLVDPFPEGTKHLKPMACTFGTAMGDPALNLAMLPPIYPI